MVRLGCAVTRHCAFLSMLSVLTFNLMLLANPVTCSDKMVFPDEVARYSRQAGDGCDISVSDEESWIFSPKYPSNYDNQRDCTYVIKKWRRSVCQIQMTINDFDLGDSSNCRSDYLDIRQGTPNAGSRVLCGSIPTGTKKKLTFPRGRNSMTLRFHSDVSQTYKGFMIKIKQIPNSCNRREDPDNPDPPAPNPPVHCDKYVSGFRDIIRSPNYPDEYPQNSRCRYTLQRPDRTVCQVEINFRAFELEQSPSCRNDFLELPGGARLCGVYLTPVTLEYLPGTNSMSLTFFTDNYGSAPGFEGEVRQLKNSCGRNNPPKPVYPDRCDREIWSLRDRITSPDYPHRYQPEQRCRYVIRRYDRTVCAVVLTLLRFEVPGSSYGCEGAHLTLPDGTRLCGTLTGQKTVYFERHANSLVIEFVSDWSAYQGRGFDIRVTQLQGSCERHDPWPVLNPQPLLPAQPQAQYYPNTNAGGVRNWADAYNTLSRLGLQLYYRLLGAGQLAPVNVPPPVQYGPFCDQAVVGYDGRITSPGFPAQYLPNQKCTYTIRRSDPSVCVVMIDFNFFDVEISSRGCGRDYLEMPDRTRLCGSVSGQRVYKYPRGSGTLQLHFNADNFGSGRGFDLKIRQRPNSCGSVIPGDCDQTIHSETDIIRSPNYPSDYPSGSRCVYTIEKVSSDVCEVRLDILDFDVADNNQRCDSDYLEIENLQQRLCGRDPGAEKVVYFPQNSDSMKLFFKSTSYEHRRGFEIRVTQLRNSCFKPQPIVGDDDKTVCATIRDFSASIQSDNYPSNYNPNTDCTFNIIRASREVCRVELSFVQFDVGSGSNSICIGDYLEVPGYGRYCGLKNRQTITVDFPSNQRELNLRFKTDSYDQRSGFRIEIRQLTQGCGGNVDPPINRDCGGTYKEDNFDLISPGFQGGSYPPNEECRYVIKKNSFDICALEIKYNVFDLEESDDCAKDFVEVGDQKVCGKLPFDSTRTYEFPEDSLTVRFRSDNFGKNAGFFMTVKQKKC